MIVTNLSYTRNGDEVDMFIDYKFCKRLLLDTIVSAVLFIDKVLTKDELRECILLDIKTRIFKKALNYISIRPRSEYEITIYLRNCINKILKFNTQKDLLENLETLIQEVLLKLKTLKYINDSQFAKWLIESRVSTKKKSRNESLLELYHKGIKSNEAQEFISDNYSSQDELSTLRYLLEKKWPDLNEVRKETKKKTRVINYFLRRGFDYALIKEALSI